jgi:hypothetical protein
MEMDRTSTVGGVDFLDFLDFLDFQFLTTEIGLATDQCRQRVYFIFMSCYAEMSFWGPKKENVAK